MRNSKTALILAALLTSGPLTAGTVQGSVSLSGKPAAGILVSIEGIQERPASAAQTFLEHRGPVFAPHLLAIVMGTTVEFRYPLGMPCRLYSVSPAGAFNLTRQERTTKSLRFDQPGVVEVRCQDHPHSHAYIVVKENPWYAITGGSGEYKIEGMPEGTYRIQVWSEGRILENRALKVGKDKAFLDLCVEPPDPDRQAQARPHAAAAASSAIE